MKKTIIIIALFLLLAAPAAAQPECPPQAVDLAYFRVRVFPGHSTFVEWETAQELDNLGFNLYRAVTRFGPRQKLNGALIPAANPGTALGAHYGYVDVGNGTWYWLEDVDAGGKVTLHGPARVSLPLPRSRPGFGLVLGGK